MNVKKYTGNRRCYLTLEEQGNGVKIAEARAVIWSNYYGQVEDFERATKQTFADGIQIQCLVEVRYHKVYGLNLDIVKIDFAHTLGEQELLRQRTLERLLADNPKHIRLIEGRYMTYNNHLPLPRCITRVALITAPNSDGQRDFLQELTKNRHDYVFDIDEYSTTIQGDTAAASIRKQLGKIAEAAVPYDVVAIVRGGGAQSDFAVFDEYALCQCVALFDTPIFTGIGHDRNQSISDMMARELKTPTRVASYLVDHNFEFENSVLYLSNKLDVTIQSMLREAKNKIEYATRIVQLADPQTIVNRGFAIVRLEGKICVDVENLSVGASIDTELKNGSFSSTITQKKDTIKSKVNAKVKSKSKSATTPNQNN